MPAGKQGKGGAAGGWSSAVNEQVGSDSRHPTLKYDRCLFKRLYQPDLHRGTRRPGPKATGQAERSAVPRHCEREGVRAEQLELWGCFRTTLLTAPASLGCHSTASSGKPASQNPIPGLACHPRATRDHAFSSPKLTPPNRLQQPGPASRVHGHRPHPPPLPCAALRLPPGALPCATGC